MQRRETNNGNTFKGLWPCVDLTPKRWNVNGLLTGIGVRTEKRGRRCIIGRKILMKTSDSETIPRYLSMLSDGGNE